MLDFAIFAITFVLTLIGAVIYLMPSSRKSTTIPGLDPTTTDDGNLSDISRAGSLHEFLMDLHQRFGGIASFWMGKQSVVSIASPELFKQHQNIFDRPCELFKIYEPMLGKQSIQYSNGSEGRAKRNAYDAAFSHQEIISFYPKIQKLADKLLETLNSKVKEEHISWNELMFSYAFDSTVNALFGESLSKKETEVMRANYDIAMLELEKRTIDANIPGEDNPRVKSLNQALKEMRKIITKVVEGRKKHSQKSEEYLLIDAIIDHMKHEEGILDETMTYIVAGFHTSSNLLIWAAYFIATHKDVEKKLLKEIQAVLGDEEINPDNFEQLHYTRQVLDETLRCAVIAPWAARFQDFDSELGGHKIPKNTPVIHALGVVLKDEKYWPLPNKFDPERFSTENSKKRPTLAFSPFGFAGKRICPGKKFAYLESVICLVTLVRNFKVTLVEGQVVIPAYGFVTHPEEEIWVTVSKRK